MISSSLGHKHIQPMPGRSCRFLQPSTQISVREIHRPTEEYRCWLGKCASSATERSTIGHPRFRPLFLEVFVANAAVPLHVDSPVRPKGALVVKAPSRFHLRHPGLLNRRCADPLYLIKELAHADRQLTLPILNSRLIPCLAVEGAMQSTKHCTVAYS